MADMDTGWSLSSGRPEAGPGGRCDEISCIAPLSSNESYEVVETLA